MNIEQICDHCKAKKGAEEDMPFGDNVLVYKVKGKIFLLLNLATEPIQFNVKCDPEKAIELREEYSAVLPGYHMNKKHWNTVIVDGSMSNKLLKEIIDHSYELVGQSRKDK